MALERQLWHEAEREHNTLLQIHTNATQLWIAVTMTGVQGQLLWLAQHSEDKKLIFYHFMTVVTSAQLCGAPALEKERQDFSSTF